jgi:hypothetical protein
MFNASLVSPRQPGEPVYITRAQLAGLRSSAYRDVLASYGVGYASALPRIPNALYVTNCCGTKGINIPHGTPEVFYTGKNQQRFISAMRASRYELAILSDLYGIHFSDESLPLYDLAPNQLTQDDLWKRGLLIRKKLLEKYGGLPLVVYVKTPVSTAVPYVIMLRASGCQIFISSTCA